MQASIRTHADTTGRAGRRVQGGRTGYSSASGRLPCSVALSTIATGGQPVALLPTPLPLKPTVFYTHLPACQALFHLCRGEAKHGNVGSRLSVRIRHLALIRHSSFPIRRLSSVPIRVVRVIRGQVSLFFSCFRVFSRQTKPDFDAGSPFLRSKHAQNRAKRGAN